MTTSLLVSVFEVIGGQFGVASGDGQRVYDRLAAALQQDRSVTLSFRNVSTLTPAFLSAAVGRLYTQFDEDQIRGSLTVEDMDSDDVALLKPAVDTAKHYFRDPQRFERAAKEVLGDDDDGWGIVGSQLMPSFAR